MVRESIVIVFILAFASYAFSRSKGVHWASGVFPLMLAPFVNIFLSPHRLVHLSNATAVRVALYFVLLAATAVWTALWARRLTSRRSKLTYMLCVLGFTAIFLLVVFFKGTAIA